MITLFPHQQEALQETKDFDNIAVYHDMGLGKTFTGSEMMIRFDCRVNLIVCQKSKVQDWIDHFKEHYRNRVVPFNLTQKKSLEGFLDWNEGQPEFIEIPYTVGIINYELAWRRKQLLNLQNFTLMLDESSLIQNKKAKQSKFILKLKPSHVILLSGTPVGGKYENLWTQVHLLGWNITESTFNNTFINWKIIDAGGFKHKIVDRDDPYKNTERMKRKMREHGAVFLKTEDVINLPEQRFQIIRVDTPAEYWKFKKDSLIEIDTQNLCEFHDDSDFEGTDVTPRVELVGDTTLTKLLYERQICSQYNPNKWDALKDLMEGTQDRLIVFYSFDTELDRLKKICKTLNRPTSEINGHTKDLTVYEQESNSVTLCQYQSASKGLNLQKCNKMIYFSLPLSSENFEQSKKRIHRIGQKQSCMYYILIARDSVEERILQTLKERKDFTDALFEEETS